MEPSRDKAGLRLSPSECRHCFLHPSKLCLCNIPEDFRKHKVIPGPVQVQHSSERRVSTPRILGPLSMRMSVDMLFEFNSSAWKSKSINLSRTHNTWGLFFKVFSSSRFGSSAKLVAMQNLRPHSKHIKLKSAFSQGPQLIHIHIKVKTHSSDLNLIGVYILVNAGSCHHC